MSTQHKISKARPPRVQISYDVEVGGSETKKELPLVLGVMGEFAQDTSSLQERQLVHVSKDNFNDVMEGMQPSVDLLVDSVLPEHEGNLAISLQFSSMDDFNPESIVAQVEPLRKLLALREELNDLRNRTSSNDKLKEQLAELIQSTQGKTQGMDDE